MPHGFHEMAGVGRRVSEVVMCCLVIAAPALAQHAAPLIDRQGRIAVSAAPARASPLAAAAAREAARAATASLLGPPVHSHAGEPWIVRHPIASGALIGTGAGALLSTRERFGAGDIRFTLLGTAVGAWGGAIGSAVHQRRGGQRVSGGTTLGIVAGALGLVVWPATVCLVIDPDCALR